MTDRELMQMALQDIKNSIGITKDEWKPRADIMCNLLRDRLAQPKPEPVFYAIQATDRFGEGYEQTYWEDPNGFPVYAAPVHASDISQKRVDETVKCGHDWVEMQCSCGHKMYVKHTGREWVGLTEVDIYDAMDNEDEFEFAKAIEAKLKEKNT